MLQSNGHRRGLTSVVKEVARRLLDLGSIAGSDMLQDNERRRGMTSVVKQVASAWERAGYG